LEEDSDQLESSRFRRPDGSRRGAVAAFTGAAILAAAGLVISGAGDRLRFRGEPAAIAGSASAFEGKSSATGQSSAARGCWHIPGVQVAEPDATTSPWKACSPKWYEDCSETGCCSDWGMQCYRKDKNWATCKAACTQKDEKNESWTCEEISPPTPHTPEGCFAQCKGQATCKQAVFSTDGGGSCRFSAQRLTHIAWAADTVNSTFCGEDAEAKDAMHKVYKNLPFQMEWPLVNCSWGGEDCSKTKCCNDYICDKDYNNCNFYSCYTKTEYFAGCAAEPLDGWKGKWLGGGREHRVVPPASEQVAVQGMSLYCFTVVTWDAPAPKPFWNSEKELALNWQNEGLHILQCDGHEVVDGVMTPKAEWGSFSNIDMFMEVWEKIKGIGEWQNYDWTVKVDSDAVFIPSRLKDHLLKLRTPMGARVYLENIDFKFKFMGAIEIMSKEAVRVFLELGHTCIRGEHEGGEDSFLKGCLDGLGVDHQIDHEILRDKYAGLKGGCTDGWAVAYHYMKKTHDWAACYNEVMCGAADPPCDQGIPVPHPPGWSE